MNKNFLIELYNAKFEHPFPFTSQDIDEITETNAIDKSILVNDFDTRYARYLETHKNVPDSDYEIFFSDLKKTDQEQVICSTISVKNHFLTFILNAGKTELISVFPLKKWRNLTLA